MGLFILLQIACSSEDASCPAVSGASVVLADDTTGAEDIGDTAEVSPLVGHWDSNIGTQYAWDDGCSSELLTQETESVWISDLQVRQEADGLLWGQFEYDTNGTQFALVEDGYGGFTMTGERPTALGTMLANFSGVVIQNVNGGYLLMGTALLLVYKNEDNQSDCASRVGWVATWRVE